MCLVSRFLCRVNIGVSRFGSDVTACLSHTEFRVLFLSSVSVSSSACLLNVLGECCGLGEDPCVGLSLELGGSSLRLAAVVFISSDSLVGKGFVV